MSIGPVTRRKTSLNALWARWFDATRTAPSEPPRVKQPAAKSLAPTLGLARRENRRAAPESMQQMAPRRPPPMAAAFNGTEVMARVLNARRRK